MTIIVVILSILALSSISAFVLIGKKISYVVLPIISFVLVLLFYSYTHYLGYPVSLGVVKNDFEVIALLDDVDTVILIREDGISQLRLVKINLNPEQKSAIQKKLKGGQRVKGIQPGQKTVASVDEIIPQSEITFQFVIPPNQIKKDAK